jgi:two-component system, NtrC family, sensor kinase
VTILARIQSSVRAKLLALVLLPLLVVLPALLSILAIWGGTAYDQLLIYKVRSDLAVANGYFEHVQVGVGNEVGMLAASHRLARTLATHDRIALSDFLKSTRQSLRVDFLHLVDAHGRVMGSSGRLPDGAFLGDQPIVQGALGGRAMTVLDIFGPEQLGAIDPKLLEQVSIPIVATRNATPDVRKEENRGMVIHAAAPVFGDDGRLYGALVGGLLLNRNLAFVDRINEIIYSPDSLPFGSHGTATLFLDDVRIATNVRLFEDSEKHERAIGTRVSSAVRSTVLDRGETWLDRAFVVNDWYVSAYQPLTDSSGKHIGMLYVGFLEAPFRAIKQWVLTGLVGIFVLAILLATVLSVKWARSIFSPIERMHTTMNAIENGNAGARVGSLPSQDEIGELAAHLDRLIDRQQAQNEELRRWGAELDAKVAERTAALASSNLELREAQRRLVMSEKLAAIGELTAGVAHEINNPVAVIQGNLDVLREVLGEQTAPVQGELKLMDDQVERIRLIVAKLLQFARPTEFAGYMEIVFPREVFSDSLLLVGHLLKRGNIAIDQRIESSRGIAFNRNELQQVIINLLVNAIQAMPEGGSLSLLARDWDENGAPQGVALSISDTGIGITPENLDRIFDPFFSTKGQGGTGLGLSVSYGLVERYDGRISVESSPGSGAKFTVWVHSDFSGVNM